MHKYGINMFYVLKAELNAFTSNTFFGNLLEKWFLSVLLLLARSSFLRLVPTILLVDCFAEVVSTEGGGGGGFVVLYHQSSNSEK
jgi:hypothetical protein